MNNEHDEDENVYDIEHEPEFHERIDILKVQGYCGFTLTGSKQKWVGVKVIAGNSSGKKLVSDGETNEVAFKKIIDMIDYILDDK